MSRRARRYDDRKLNYKKIFAVIVLFIVIIMFIVGIKRLFTTGITSTGKIMAINYFPVYSNGKWGIIDSNGDIVIEPQYNEMPVVINNTQPVFMCTYDVNYENGTYKISIVNKKNKSIITGYDNIRVVDYVDKEGKLVYAENLFIVEKNGKFGLVDSEDKNILNIEYDEISVLDGLENSLLIKKDDSFGLCDYDGNIIIDVQYKEIKAIGDNYKNGYITVNKDGLFGIVDFNKSVVLESKFLDIKPIYASNKYVVKINEGYKVIDKTGDILVDKTFTDIKGINDENIIFKENGKYGIINFNLDNKVEPKYEDIFYMGSNNYAVKSNGLYGVININGEKQIDSKYNSIEYDEIAGIAIAKSSKNNFDVYDSTMTYKFTVDDIEIVDSYMIVSINDDVKYYNFKFEEKSSRVILSNNNIIADKKDGKYGFVKADGSVVVDYKYDNVTEVNKYGYAGVKLNGLWGVVNAKGEIILEPTYNLDKNEEIDFIGKWHKGIGADYYTNI